MAVEPLKPEDIIAPPIPDEVIEIFNQLISKNFRVASQSAFLKQDEVVEAIISRMEVDRKHIFDNGWLDVEPLYRNAGWDVVYDKPGYSETYPANFKFSKRR